MDVLSEVLKAVALKGALFYNAEYSAPWSFRAPSSGVLASQLGPDGGHVILYHLVVEGSAWAQLEDGPRISLQAGDLVVFPHGDSHLMGNGSRSEAVDHGKELQRILAQGVKISRAGGGGPVTRFICGYMVCDPELTPRVLAGLPPVFTINIRNDEPGAWLENSIRFSVSNAGSAAAGADVVLAKLSEVLFAETLRRYLAVLPAEQKGWLAGVRDPAVGKALALLHRHPGHPWTIASLAKGVGVSRAGLAQRFQHYLGEGPIGYLTRWRMQLGARVLSNSSQSVAQIAARVGYDSEAAFNRAFKRQFGSPPARFRRTMLGAPHSYASSPMV
jgi:AraC-like DNA-binding protein